MEKEKIKQIYEKYDIVVTDDVIEAILKNNKKVEGLKRVYKEEEIESMNYIFGKDRENKYFTKRELNIASKINLLSREALNICRNIYVKEMKEGVC